MPTTSRHPVRGSKGVSNAINYIIKDEKTNNASLVSTLNCNLAYAVTEFEANYEKYHIELKDGDRSCYHLYQSFSPDEKNLTSEECHKMGVELAKKLYPNYQCVIATHIDRNHLHNHIVFNALNSNGKKLEDRLANPIEGLYGLRDASDTIALAHGFKIIENAPKIGRYKTRKYVYDLATESWKSQIITDIENLKESCLSFDEMLENLALMGYSIKTGKNIKIKPFGKTRYVSFKYFAKGEYSEQKLREFFYEKRKGVKRFNFAGHNVDVKKGELLQFQSQRIKASQNSIELSTNGIEENAEYPKYFNTRYREYRRYNKLVDTINFLNENNIFNHNDLLDKIEEIKNEIEIKESDYFSVMDLNETLQLRIPLAEQCIKYQDDYEAYLELVAMHGSDIEVQDGAKIFMDTAEELGTTDIEEIKNFLTEATQFKKECNKKFAYLSYLKNKISSLEQIRGKSMENDNGYVKGMNFDKSMIDEKRSNELMYCVRLPYTSYYVYLPNENVVWTKYDRRARMYLVDDKKYMLYDELDNEVEEINGEELDQVSQYEKEKVKEYYANKV